MTATVIAETSDQTPESGVIPLAEVAPVAAPTLDSSYRARGERIVMAVVAEVIGDALRAVSIANQLGQRAVSVAQRFGRSEPG